MPMITIYRVTCAVNGKSYIGMTGRSLKERWRGHLWRAQNKSSNAALHIAIRRYGPSAFKIATLAVAPDRNKAGVIERHLIAAHRTLAPNGYNLTAGGDGGDTFTGRHHSPETKAKMSAAGTGKPKSAEHRAKLRKPKPAGYGAKMSAMRRGKKPSAETRAKMGIAHRNSPFRAEQLARLNIRRGKSPSEKQRAAIAASNRKRSRQLFLDI